MNVKIPYSHFQIGSVLTCFFFSIWTGFLFSFVLFLTCNIAYFHCQVDKKPDRRHINLYVLFVQYIFINKSGSLVGYYYQSQIFEAAIVLRLGWGKVGQME